MDQQYTQQPNDSSQSQQQPLHMHGGSGSTTPVTTNNGAMAAPAPTNGAVLAAAAAAAAPFHSNPHSHSHLPHPAQVLPPSALAGMDPKIMEQLMTNPALAAAAAASPLFPPSAMVTNPGAFMTLPEYYSSPAAMQNDLAAKGSAATIALTVGVNNKTQQVMVNQASGQPGAASSSQPHAQPLQHQQQQHPIFGFPTGLQQTLLAYGAGLAPNGQQLLGSTTNSAQAVHHMAAAAANDAQSMVSAAAAGSSVSEKYKKEMTEKERARLNRDRNREHARSTRLRKKAYVQKLKELVEGLHSERTEEVRQRRVAIQHLAEMQNVRRAVIHSFLRFHAGYEQDERKWSTILEEDTFWLKQPVTPYRCFRRSEIEQEYRIARGVEGVIADAASIAAMVEAVGSRSARWVRIKREEFFLREEERTGHNRMPKDIVQQRTRFQHAISSLSSSSNSSNNGSSSEEGNNKRKRATTNQNSPGGASAQQGTVNNISNSSNEGGQGLHDYHAKPLPDPKLPDQDRNSEEYDESGDDSKRVNDISSGEDSAAAIKEGRPAKRQKSYVEATGAIVPVPTPLPTPFAKMPETAGLAAAKASTVGFLPPNISKRGGIAHNVRPVAAAVTAPKNGNARLAFAPAVVLPPFAGIGKRNQVPTVSVAAAAAGANTTGSVAAQPICGLSNNATVAGAVAVPRGDTARVDFANAAALDGPSTIIPAGPAVISGDVETSSSNNTCRTNHQIRAYYHVNEDDMILMEDVIMCPFVFRTKDAVKCGALAECVMHGMLRGHFSSRNKLQSVEMIYDAMGFMQQLERASGSEMMAQIIPGSLEMALSPGSQECRVITLAVPPYRIVNVNEAWTKLTKYSQMEAEGMELFNLLECPATEGQPASPPYELDGVMEGRCRCTTRFHCDKDGREYVDFVSSYPLTNASDQITHLLHTCKELAPPEEVSEGSPESSFTANDGISATNNNKSETNNDEIS